MACVKRRVMRQRPAIDMLLPDNILPRERSLERRRSLVVKVPTQNGQRKSQTFHKITTREKMVTILARNTAVLLKVDPYHEAEKYATHKRTLFRMNGSYIQTCWTRTSAQCHRTRLRRGLDNRISSRQQRHLRSNLRNHFRDLHHQLEKKLIHF
jgi:hypothetical protein